MLHVGLDKPEYYLTNADIEGSKTQVNKFVTKREPSSPLNPVYKLPSFTYVPPEPPKFVRDAMEINDIAGTRSTKPRAFGPRGTNKVEDIPVAMQKAPYERKKLGEFHYNSMSYRDVTSQQWATRRSTNPLEPCYTVDDARTGDFTRRPQTCQLNKTYGAIEKNKPAGLPTKKVGERSLNTLDIVGAQPDTKRQGPFTWMKRRQVREVNVTSDIQGGQADTLKRACTTKRCLNPLEPSYVIPGHSEYLNTINDPYGERTSSMAKANFKIA